MFRFAIDRGGTFTDVYAECPDGSTRVMKLLSEDPENYQDAPREAIRRILQEVSLSGTQTSLAGGLTVNFVALIAFPSNYLHTSENHTCIYIGVVTHVYT